MIEKVLDDFSVRKNDFAVGKNDLEINKNLTNRRNTWFFKHNGKNMIIKKTHDNIEHINFVYNIQKKIYDEFPHIYKYNLNVSGNPYSIYGDDIYIMHEVYSTEQKKADFTDCEYFEEILKVVGKFHNIAKNIEFDKEKYFGQIDLLKKYKDSINALKSVKKHIGNSKRLSDFDVLFIKNYNHNINILNECIHILEKIDYENYIKDSYNNCCICHNNLKEDNIIFDGKIIIDDFQYSNIDLQLVDLCKIIQKYIKRCGSDFLTIDKIINIYSSVKKISKTEKALLLVLLKYPEKFINITLEYYSKNRTWTPNAIIVRMENFINMQLIQSNYLKEYEENVLKENNISML